MYIGGFMWVGILLACRVNIWGQPADDQLIMQPARAAQNLSSSWSPNRSDLLINYTSKPSFPNKEGNWNFDYHNNLVSNKSIDGSSQVSGTSHQRNNRIRRGSWVVSNNRGTTQIYNEQALENESNSDDPSGSVTLVHGIRVCEISVSVHANTAVLQAATFLSKDIQKISGYAPRIVHKKLSVHSDLSIIHLATLGIDDIPANLENKVTKLQGAWEAYRIITSGADVWLIGSDARGTAYAAYELSERLGIDPLYLWTGYQPERHNPLVVKKTNYYQPSPVFKYRGFFHDDEDILPRPFDEQGHPYRFGNVPLDWYKRFFETALRLRMNMVAPYTRVRRRFEVQKCASDWGLFYTSHHYDILLSNPFGIDRFRLAEKRGVSKDWDWLHHSDDMLGYWKGGVAQNKDLSVIWPIGLRGTDDHAYHFPTGTSEQQQARVFGQVLDSQVALVGQMVPENNNPVFAFTLYTEMLEKYQKNQTAFRVPKKAIIVWPDDNDGIMRNLPEHKDQWKHGIYYHLAYFGGAKTKQSVSTVAPERIAEQFKKIIACGATEYLLVNVSEFREFALGARMIAEISWKGSSTISAPDSGKHTGVSVGVRTDSIPDFLNWWTREYFGPNQEKSVSKFYKSYYHLLSNPEITCFGSVMVQQMLLNLYRKLNGVPCNNRKTDSISKLLDRVNAYAKLFSELKTITDPMRFEQKRFFFENAELGLLMDYRQCQAAWILWESLQTTGNKSDFPSLYPALRKALHPLEQLELEILGAERPPFENWYRSTWIRPESSKYNVHRSYNELSAFINSEGRSSPVIPVKHLGHRIPEHRIWSIFLDKLDSLKSKGTIEQSESEP